MINMDEEESWCDLCDNLGEDCICCLDEEKPVKVLWLDKIIEELEDEEVYL
jgi:hypothetical protein